MAVMRIVQKISVGKVGRKDSLLKLRRRLEDNIKIERRNVGYAEISFGQLGGVPCEDDTEPSYRLKDSEFLDLLRDSQLLLPGIV